MAYYWFPGLQNKSNVGTNGTKQQKVLHSAFTTAGYHPGASFAHPLGEGSVPGSHHARTFSPGVKGVWSGVELGWVSDAPRFPTLLCCEGDGAHGVVAL